MKYLTISFLTILFLTPTFSVSAFVYSDNEIPFSLSLDSNWSLFNDESYEELPIKEQKFLTKAFFSNDNKNFLYIRNLTESSYELSIFKNAIDYYERTPKELFVEDRILKPVETMAGKKIVSYSYDFVDFSLMFETDLIRNSNISFKTLTFWKYIDNQFIEFQFITYDPSKENIFHLHSIFDSILFVESSSDDAIPTGEANLSPQISEFQQTSFVSNLSLLLTTKNIYFLIGSLVFIALVSLFFHIWRRF